MSRSDAPRPDHAESAGAIGYWAGARRPIQILTFLLPVIIAYELCLALLLPAENGGVHTVLAHKRLLEFFTTFGVAATGGLYLGGLVIVVVLFIWHLLARDRWRVEPRYVVLMGMESLVLAIPLVAVGHVIAGAAPAAAAPVPVTFEGLDVWSQMAISVGAGLYEEMLFRMIFIAVLHTLLVDLGRMPNWLGATIGIVVSAAAFTWYHDLNGTSGAISGRKVLFYALAGLYFGAVYVVRGFGLVVGVHALYDIITVLTPVSDDS